MHYPHIAYCLENEVLAEPDVERLTAKLSDQNRVQVLAGEFGVPVAEMSACSLDAGIAFVRARLLTPDATHTLPRRSPQPTV